MTLLFPFFSLFSFTLFYSLLFSHLNLRVSDVLRVLKLHNHGAFPVVDRGPHVYPSLLLFLSFILFYCCSFFFFLFFGYVIYSSSAEQLALLPWNNNIQATPHSPEEQSIHIRQRVWHEPANIFFNLLLIFSMSSLSSSLSSLTLIYLSVPSRMTYEDFTASLARMDFDVNHLEKELTSRDLELHIDLSPCISSSIFILLSSPPLSSPLPPHPSFTLTMKDINSSATVVHETCSYTEAYRLFRTMGLRHLIVSMTLIFLFYSILFYLYSFLPLFFIFVSNSIYIVNVYNQVVGIITRKDLL